ncbi:uncharacterized protein LOC131950694 [Physella acuta]|uniref:uncharacterized protein LOC131950694 n=1 Tax=Physella acuta TaxID=109671 RepID=UPI0027DC7B32|nr:uncharacterized protein LOC131950694 [Physella acuta]
MASRLFIFILLYCCHYAITEACTEGWFGPSCQYKCHCLNNDCDSDGRCVDSETCEPGWFGPLCQYYDLAQRTSSVAPSCSQTTDNNDKTCSSLQTLEFNWSIGYQFTWFRIVLAQPGSLDKLVVSLKESSRSLANITCSDQGQYKVNEKITDIVCNIRVTATRITFDFQSITTVCSVYISGGRNVALKQATVQSSDYSDLRGVYLSSKAVDGNNSGNILELSCSHTQSESFNFWKVFFNRPYDINRYVIYNRDNLRERLSGFVLVTRDSVNRSLFTFTDPAVNMDVGVYNITSKTSVAATYTQISGTTFLTLCEVEIYGDNHCSQIYFGLECNMNCNCMNPTEKCFVATGGCRSGCAAGYQGEGCLQECGATTYGINCSLRCSINCLRQQCHHINGSCEECVAGREGAFCEEGCVSGLYGDTCQYNETDLWCNKFNGTCVYGLGDVLHGNVRSNDDRLAEGIGIGIGIMCVVFLVVAVAMFIIRRCVTTTNLTVEIRPREQQSETTQYSHTENSGAQAGQSSHQYDEIILDTGAYDHITPHNTMPSHYERVDINTENSHI